jgi:hypothetical protein
MFLPLMIDCSLLAIHFYYEANHQQHILYCRRAAAHDERLDVAVVCSTKSEQ